MSESIDRFIGGAMSAAAALACRDQAIERLEAENAQLSTINRLLIEKIEWFSTLHHLPAAKPIAVAAPREVSVWPPRKDFAFIGVRVFCAQCGEPFERSRGHRTLCKECRGQRINAGRKDRQPIERIAV